jgi:hypothetical protein
MMTVFLCQADIERVIRIRLERYSARQMHPPVRIFVGQLPE